jgi:hypothetical protein
MLTQRIHVRNPYHMLVRSYKSAKIITIARAGCPKISHSAMVHTQAPNSHHLNSLLRKKTTTSVNAAGAKPSPIATAPTLRSTSEL